MIENPNDIFLPRDRLLCEKCESVNKGAFRFMLATDLLQSKKVEVLSLMNEYDDERKLYRVRAKIKWNCPDCGIPLTRVTKLKEVPVEILTQISEICPECENPLKLRNEKIEISKLNDLEDIIILSGNLVCDKCSNKSSYMKNLKTTFSSVIAYFNSITKMKISQNGVEFERQ